MNVEGTGFVSRVDNFKNRIPEFDPEKGEHYWIVMLLHNVNPQNYLDNDMLFDYESLAAITPLGCYYCVRPYSEQLANERCSGQL